MKSAFDKIAASFGDPIAHANGAAGRAEMAASIDVAAIRKRTGKTQDQFARDTISLRGRCEIGNRAVASQMYRLAFFYR